MAAMLFKVWCLEIFLTHVATFQNFNSDMGCKKNILYKHKLKLNTVFDSCVGKFGDLHTRMHTHT